MDRSRRNEGSGSWSSLHGRSARRRWVPTWLPDIRRGKPWTRFHIFHWTEVPAEPPFDNHVPDLLTRAVTWFSRAMGPVLLLAACAAAMWGGAVWMGW